MSTQEHAAAVRLALKTNRELKTLFNRLGTSEAPRGRVLTAFRQARRALAGNVDDLNIVRAVLFELRQTLDDVAYTQLQAAADLGLDQAERTLAVYGISTPPPAFATTEAYEAWMATIDGQLAGTLALAVQNNESAILGDDRRVGQLSPAPVVREGARWLADVAARSSMNTFDRAVGNQSQQSPFLRQAIAALDSRTTDCCLRVHGKTVEINKPFHLAGFPHYASEMDAPPFHWYCRTSVALVRREDANDALTQKMQNAASYELEQRAKTGKPGLFTYADATSRRSGIDVTPRTQRSIIKTPSSTGPTPDKLLKTWVHGAHQKNSVLLKNAIREEFGVRGLVMNRRGFEFSDSDISAARPAVRSIYADTQRALNGKKTIKLYRGVKSEIRTPGVVESWTTDLRTAKKFNGHDVIEMEIPAERIFAFSGGPNWTNGRYGEQFEYMVMAEAPR